MYDKAVTPAHDCGATPRRTLALLLALAGCAGAPRAPAEAPSHHRDGGFQNNYADFVTKGLADLLRWRLQAWRGGLPPPPREPVPVVAPDLDFLHANATAGQDMLPAVTWIGHATVLAQFAGLNLLTDPMFSGRASPVSFAGPVRAVAPGVPPGRLPHIDVVLVSHNHYDHLDEDSVKALAAQPGGSPLFLVPLRMKAFFAARGIERVVELDWWQSHRVGEVEFTLTPVQHWSARGLADRMAVLWGGWAALSPSLHLYFAGDTGYSRDFADIRRHFAARQGPQDGGGFDIALLPIGGYEPRWFMRPQHVDPQEAVAIHRDLGAKASLGIHWGTFELTDEALDEAPRELARQRAGAGLADDAFFTLAIGQTRRLPARR